MIRAVVFRLHLTVAVAAGAVVLMMAATGVILSLEETALGLAERRYFVAAGEGAQRLAPKTILESVESWAAEASSSPRAADSPGGLDGVPFVATSLRYDSDARAPVRVDVGRDRFAYVDPHTGEVLGTGPGGVEHFFEGVLNWHRWFNVSGGSVRRARAVTGAVNVAFLFLLLTGPVLWIPRRITRRSLANVLLLSPGAKGAWRDLNWHQVVGIWSCLPLVVIAATGITTSYPAVGDRVYPVVGRGVPVGEWPVREGAEAAARSAASGATAEDGNDVAGGVIATGANLAAVLATAESWAPRWRALILNLPRTEDLEVRVEVRRGRAGQPQNTGTLTVDAATGVVRGWESFGDDTPGRRAQQFLRYAHTGEYWGVGGRLLAGLFSLAATLMIWTGLSLAVRRLRRLLRLRRVLRGQ